MFHSARYIFVLLLVLVACAGSLIFCTDLWKVVSGAEKYTPIFSGKQFTENELIQIELAFADAKLSDYVISDGTVQVPKRQKTFFIQALKKTDFLTQEKAEPQSSSGGLFVSEKEREAAALRDKQAALAAQIRAFHGIESARILLDVSETKVGFTREKHASAAVSIRSRGGYSVTQEDIQSILRLVTCSVCGLKAADVTIVDTRTNQSWRFDAPQIEILPDSSQESKEKAQSVQAVSLTRPNQSHKIVFQPESLPQQELFDSTSHGILLTSAEEPISQTFSDSRNSDFQEEIPAISNEKETFPGFLNSKTDVSDLFTKVSVPRKSTAKQSSSQHSHQIMIFLGMLTAPAVLICLWIIYVTRKGLFLRNAAPNFLQDEAAKQMNPQPDAELIVNLVSEFTADDLKEKEEKKEERTAEKTEHQPEILPESVTEVSIEPENAPEPEIPQPEKTEMKQRLPEIIELEKTSPEHLVLAFLEERPQTVAMLLAQFDPEIAQTVLMNIPTKIRHEITSRMANCLEPDSEILYEAAQVILDHLTELEKGQYLAENSVEKLETVEAPQMFKTAKSTEKPVIRPLAEAIPRERVFRNFEDLKLCSDGELRKILHKTSIQDVNLALLGANPEIVNRVLGVLSTPAAKELRFQLTHPGKFRLSDVENARNRILEEVGTF